MSEEPYLTPEICDICGTVFNNCIKTNCINECGENYCCSHCKYCSLGCAFEYTKNLSKPDDCSFLRLLYLQLKLRMYEHSDKLKDLRFIIKEIENNEYFKNKK